MALFLKVSNSLESLATELAGDLDHRGKNVFDPHYIVTQTDGMNNWLKLQIAAHLGITANCRFMKPNELIHQFYRLLGGQYTEMLSADNLSWLLFKLLGSKDFMNKFPAVAQYYRDAGEEEATRRMALAEKMGDLFDQYQVYRPEMIRLWNEGIAETRPDYTWQQYLWSKAKTEAGDSLPDKTLVGTFILQQLQQPDTATQLPRKLPRVHLFGLSIITGYHVELLYELSSFIDIHFYIINPAPEVYWFEDRNEKQLISWQQKGYKNMESAILGNPILTNWGHVIQDSFALFFRHDAFLNAYKDVGIVYPVADNLLHKIQDDIFRAATAERHAISAEDIQDGSIHINACYTIAREAEALYNYLVHLIDKRKESLSPRDIVVMVSNIDDYAPYIKAVFNNAPYKFRYTIADESYNESDNIFTALQAILTLQEDNFKAEAVLQLLDSSYIRKRFGLSDLMRIREVVDAANIRFGVSGQETDDTRFVSWEYGIKRIMYGICMKGDTEYSDNEDRFFPLDLLEGSDALEIIRFCHFVEVLMDALRERRAPRDLAGWVAYIEQILYNLVLEPEEDTDEDYHALMKHLAAYNLLQEYMSEAVSYEVFSRHFLQLLGSSTRTGLFANGGITFCSLIPMRSIPFKVVALMGLNYDKFPRKEQPASFNLMTKEKQRGDRNIKENDKHLFLETLLSAKQYLYISYTGRNAKDNSVLPPSILIDELLDYIEEGCAEPDAVRPSLITVQPLQSFSHKYDSGNEQLYNYLATDIVAEKLFVKEDKATDLMTFEEISIDELIRFFKNPIKAYYNKVSGIFYNDDPVLLSDTEVFGLDSLQRWKIKTQLLREPNTNVLQERLVKTGELPLKNMAAVAIESVLEEVSPVRTLFEQVTGNAEEGSATVHIELNGTALTGIIPGIFNKTLVVVSWSKIETKYLIETYIKYMAGMAAGVLDGAQFISGAKKEAAFELATMSKEQAITRLNDLVATYKQGFSEMLAFHPDLDINPSALEELDHYQFIKQVDRMMERSQDPYLIPEYNKGFFNRETVVEEYKLVCAHILVPLETAFPCYFD